MSLVGYARVSTIDGRQVLDRQLDALNAAGCERVFQDHAPGAAPDRPSLAACLDYLRRGDVLVVLDQRGIGFRALNSPTDTTVVSRILSWDPHGNRPECQRRSENARQWPI